MTVSIPDYVTAEGNVKVAYVPAIASVTAPTATELNGASAVDITCFLPETWGGITADQSKGEQRRMCTKESFQSFGRTTRTVADFTYTYLPQATGTDPANKAKTALTPGAKGYLVVRYGPAATGAFATADKVDILPVEVGTRSKATGGSDEFAPLTITQGMVARGILVEDATVA